MTGNKAGITEVTPDARQFVFFQAQHVNALSAGELDRVIIYLSERNLFREQFMQFAE